MATEIQVVIDRAEPGGLARFWVDALHYELQDPPDGFQTWHDFRRAQGVPQESWNDASAIVDPESVGPRIYFHRVPETEVVKNRVHLDLNLGPGVAAPSEERQPAIDAEVDRSRSSGATVVRPGIGGAGRVLGGHAGSGGQGVLRAVKAVTQVVGCPGAAGRGPLDPTRPGGRTS